MKKLLFIIQNQLIVTVALIVINSIALASNSQFLSARKGQISKNIHSGQLLLSDRGLVEMKSNDQIKLMRGTLWLNVRSEVTVDTLFAQIHIPEGQVWLIVDEKQVKIKSITSHVMLKSKSGQKIEINRGFETWVGLINSLGRNEVGVPQAIDFSQYLQFWAKYYRGSKKKFISEANQLREELNLATIESAEIYQETINRQIASIEEEKILKAQQEIEKKKQIQKKKAEIYHKTFSR